MKVKLWLVLGLAAVLLVVTIGLTQAQGTRSQVDAASLSALGTGFTYQGQLKKDGNPVNNTCDFRFILYTADIGGSQVGPIQDKTAISVSNGLFTVSLDFGDGAFTGDARWLDIAVRCPSGSGTYNPLTPRQALTPTPYALALPGLRTQQNDTSPNLIGGRFNNTVTVGVYGATIGGGGAATDESTGDPVPNRVTDHYGTVTGGIGNQAGNNSGTLTDTMYATVGGGRVNIASGWESVVGGGAWNTVSGSYATIAGGVRNIASGGSSTIGGGTANSADGWGATLSGGSSNTASGDGATIGGGNSNIASGGSATVGGGQDNSASYDLATVGGGGSNIASFKGATVSGGFSNTVSGGHATIGGGWANTVSGFNATVGGGISNTVIGDMATIGGGEENFASGPHAFVGGGYQNVANQAATVGGGTNNMAVGGKSFIGGGGGNYAGGDHTVVGGGANNAASGYRATVPGGEGNAAQGGYSLAAGRRAQANHNGAFVWGDSTDADINSSNSNQFIVRANGGLWFGQAASDFTPTIGANVFISTSTGAYLSMGGAWTNASDRNAKDNFVAVDGREVLARLAEIPIATWNYGSQDSSIRHIGPVAQDFYAAFGLGEDDTHISTVDADGVALAAIQGLNESLREKDAQIASQQQRLDDLEARLSALERARPASGEPVSWPLVGAVLIISLAIGQRRRSGGRL